MIKNKKLIICLTGEPRSFHKGLLSREKIISKKIFKNVESRYHISFIKESKRKEVSKIMKAIKSFSKDSSLKNLRIEKNNCDNIWLNLLKQKLLILEDLKNEDNNLENSIILLTRTDWLFTKNCINLIDDSVKKRKIVTPYLTDIINEYKNKKYKPIFDQFMVIPGEFIGGVIESLRIACELFVAKNNNTTKKNLKLPGDGLNRYGIPPEKALGIGFLLSGAVNNFHTDDNFKFAFKPGIYNTSDHNLIRDDAHIWMNLSFKDLFIKYLLFSSDNTLSRIKSIIKFLKKKN